MKTISPATAERTFRALQANGNNIEATRKALGIGRASVYRHVDAYLRLAAAPQAGHRRYLITAAQNNTLVHDDFWNNLLAFRSHIGAELLVSRFTYNKSAYGNKARKPGTASKSDYDDLWYDDRIAPYVRDERTELADGLTFCGELNLLPTLVHPLGGLESFAARSSIIVPHAKLALRSIAAPYGRGAKFMYTTGACTGPNYVQRKEGQKAEFHHVVGALLVEIDEAGRWFVRQINAARDGSFYDLDTFTSKGRVTTGHRPAHIVWGDTHVAHHDPQLTDLCYGPGGILDTLRPQEQIFHDLFDGQSCNPHEQKAGNHHEAHRRHLTKRNDVRAEMDGATAYLARALRDDITTVVVHSNHHDFLQRWLNSNDWRNDHVNVRYWLALQQRVYDKVACEPLERMNVFHIAMRESLWRTGVAGDVRLLHEDESYISAGIECGNHGHLGPNGARGSAANLSKLGVKMNIGHVHGAEIRDGVYAGGTMSRMRHGYNRGPSSWSPSFIVGYPNGKRAIVTVWDYRWRA